MADGTGTTMQQGQAVYPIQGDQPITFVTVPPDGQPLNYKSRVAFWLGISQIIIGAVVIVLNGILYIPDIFNSYIAFLYGGIWNGALFIVTGIIAVLSAKYKTRCLIISTMVLSIVSSLGATIMVIFALMAFIVSGLVTYPNYSKATAGLDGTLCFLCVGEFIVCMVQAAYCCGGVCDCCRDQPKTMIAMAAVPAGTTELYPAIQSNQINDNGIAVIGQPYGTASQPPPYEEKSEKLN